MTKSWHNQFLFIDDDGMSTWQRIFFFVFQARKLIALGFVTNFLFILLRMTVNPPICYYLKRKKSISVQPVVIVQRASTTGKWKTNLKTGSGTLNHSRPLFTCHILCEGFVLVCGKKSLLSYDSWWPQNWVMHEKQGRIHGNPIADGWAGAVMRKPLGIQICDGRTYWHTDRPTDRHGKV